MEGNNKSRSSAEHGPTRSGTAREASVAEPFVLPCDWATWQLLDSLLPTGGFAHSYGLEAALQAGLIAGPPGLQNFIISALENAGGQLLPFVHDAHQNASDALQCASEDEGDSKSTGSKENGKAGGMDAERMGESVQHDESVLASGMTNRRGSKAVSHWVELDSILHAMLANHVARRASISQGTALLRVAAALFPESGLLAEMRVRARKQPLVQASKQAGPASSRTSNPSESTRGDLMSGSGSDEKGVARAAGEHSGKEGLAGSHSWQPHMHHAPLFGTVCGLVGMDSLTTQRAYLFTTLRDVLSAATRLNVIGPLEAAVLQRRLTPTAEAILHRSANRPVAMAHQTAPLLDIVQGGHDALFSRLFST